MIININNYINQEKEHNEKIKYLKDKYNFRLKKLVEKISAIKKIVDRQKDDFIIYKESVNYL